MRTPHSQRQREWSVEIREERLRSPASIGAERAVLGAILLDNLAFNQAMSQNLQVEDFSLDSHRRIYGRMRDLGDQGRTIDLITLAEELSCKKEVEAVGGVAYLSSLTDGLPQRPSIEHYVQIVQNKAALRLIAHGAEAIQRSACSSDADPAAIAELLNEVAERARESLCIPGIRRLEDVPNVFSFDAGAISYLVPDLIPRGALVLLTGPPGVGKSSFALKLAIACTSGGEFLGRQCERIECLYLDKENPLLLVQERMRVFGGGPVPGLHLWGGWSTKDEPPMIGDARLLSIAANERPLIVFDSKVRFHTSDENSASEMRVPMGHLRKLADAGATVLVLHHRAKAEGSKYRGSTDILAAVDVAYTLEEADELLHLRQFKSRFSPEQVIHLRADFATGRFDVMDSPVATQRRDDVSALAEAIADKPGMRQTQIIEQVRMGRTNASNLLKLHEGKLWRSEPGAHGSLCYFPISCTEYRPVPSKPGTPRARCTAVPAPLGAVQSTVREPEMM